MDRLALLVLRKRGPKLEPLVQGIQSGDGEELHLLRSGVAVLSTESHREIIAAGAGALEALASLVGAACLEALLTNLEAACRHPRGGDAVPLVKCLVEISGDSPENPLPALVDPLVSLLAAPEIAAREVAAVALYTLCRSGDEARAGGGATRRGRQPCALTPAPRVSTRRSERLLTLPRPVPRTTRW